VDARILALAEEPRPPGVVKMQGSEATTASASATTVVYAIEDAVLLVLVVRIGHRREVYR
jgi:mRNA interferase RelE/StbE